MRSADIHYSESVRIRIRASAISLVVGIAVCLVKFAGFLTTNSYAILSDASESIINVVAAAFALYAIVQGSKKADREHPYGMGRLEYLSASLEGGLIAVAGILILFQSVPLLWTGNEVKHLNLGLIFTGVGTIANALLGFFLVRTGKKYHSLALKADGKHVLTDVISSVGMFGGLVALYLTGASWLDPLIACIMAIWILFTGFQLLRESLSQLMDRSSPETTNQITSALQKARVPEMIRPHKLRLREAGQFVLVDFHLIVPRYFNAAQLHHLETNIHNQLEKDLARPVDLLLHNDPCGPQNCIYCAMPSCDVRAKKQSREITWTTSQLIEDVKHPHERQNAKSSVVADVI